RERAVALAILLRAHKTRHAENRQSDARRKERKHTSARRERRRTRPGNRGEGFRESRDARRGVTAAEVAALRLRAKPELDHGGGDDRDGSARCCDRRLIG